MNNSEYLSEEKTIETYTYYDLSQLTSCLLDETNELQQDFKRKSSFFCDQHELISNNETKASVSFTNLNSHLFCYKTMYNLASTFKLLYTFIENYNERSGTADCQHR